MLPNNNNNEAEVEAPVNEEAMSVDVDDCVLVGPDLNAYRALTDTKTYRHFIIKKNGLRCIVISDTIAMVEERHDQGNFGEDSGHESETSSVVEENEKNTEDAGGDDGDEGEECKDEEAGIRSSRIAFSYRFSFSTQSHYFQRGKEVKAQSAILHSIIF